MVGCGFHLRCDLPVLSRLKGPPPPLEGPLAVNTRLQKGRRLFAGQLRGPESFTADEEGEQQIQASLACALFTCGFQVTCTRAPWTGSCGGLPPTTVSPSSRRWDRSFRNAVGVTYPFFIPDLKSVHLLFKLRLLRQQHGL